MFPGGTGTSSRIVNGKYTVGVLVQSNYGHTHDLQIGGVPVGKLLLKEKPDYLKVKADAFSGKADDGSIVIILM
jgi:D-aminopeptidase